MWSLQVRYRDQGARHFIPFECHSKLKCKDHSKWERTACRPKFRRGHGRTLSGPANNTADVAGSVPVYFRFADSLIYACPGDNFLEVYLLISCVTALMFFAHTPPHVHPGYTALGRHAA